MKKYYYKILRFMVALVVGMFMSVFAMGSANVYAAQSQEVVVISEEPVPLDSEVAESDNAGSAVFLLMGGMLLIIIAVVISIVVTVAFTAPIADEV